MSRRHIVLTAVVSLAAALVLAACGGTVKTGVSGVEGASMFKSGALAYAAVDSDLGSNQWQQVDDLLKKFPARQQLLDQIRKSLNDEGVNYDRDVKEALGPEVDVAVVAGTGNQPAVVAITKPDSMDKAKALVRKLGARDDTPPVIREIGDWLAISDKEQSFDRVLKGSGGSSLADDSTFTDAMDALPGDALAKAYVNGRQLNDLVNRYIGQGAQTTAAGDSGGPFANVDWLAAALDAKDNGVRLQFQAKGSGADKTFGAGAFTSKLISGIPGDAFAFANFRGGSLGDQIAKLRKNPAFSEGFDEAEKELRMRLDDVLALFEHEVAFYVRRGPGLPEFSLALETPDTQSALTTVDRLMGRIAHLAPGTLGTDNQGGVPVKTLTIKPVTVRWAGFDGRILLTTGPTGISDYRADGSKLADDATYKHALDAAGAPDKTGGVFYVNIHDATQLIQSYLGVSGGKLPADVAANLKPLQSFVAYSSTSGDVAKGVAFVEIK